MRFPPSLLDEIRARLPVSQVVGRRVKLRRQGREFIGLSPFNAEKTPSFTVNDVKGFYHCFSSGRHGDIFRFVMETEGLGFAEAVERLAGEAGVPLPARDAQMEAREAARAGVAEVMEAAATFFEERLAGPEGRDARAYLDRRGVARELWRTFRLGYAPSARHALKEHLAARFDAALIVRSGVLVTGDGIAVPFDRFRNRLMFPITDLRGRPIAFGGRALSADAQAKYLNSPETELFHKGRVLFNLAGARRAAHDAGTVIVAEGYMDVIALHGAGWANVVAPLGTALTEDQLGLLWRIAGEPVLCFDGDGAGLRAAFRALDLALPELAPGRSLRFALLPEGQDPDDLIRAGGRDAMKEVLDRARPLDEILWMREREAGPLDTPERRAALEMRLRDAIGRISDVRVRRHYEEAMRSRLGALFARRAASGPRAPGRARGRDAAGRGAGREGLRPAAASTELLRQRSARGTALPRRECIMLLALVHHRELLVARVEELASLAFSRPELERLRDALIDIAGGEGDAREGLARRGLGETLARLESQWLATRRQEWWISPDAALADAERGWDHTAALHHRNVALHKELMAAERALEEDPSEENQARLFDIHAQMASAEGTEALLEGFGQASGRPARAF